MTVKIKFKGFKRGLQKGSDRGKVWFYTARNQHIGTVEVTESAIEVFVPFGVEVKVKAVKSG